MVFLDVILMKVGTMKIQFKDIRLTLLDFKGYNFQGFTETETQA